MLLLVPLLGGEGVVSFSSILLKLGFSLGVLVLVIAAAWFLVPLILKRIAELRSPEVFILTIVFLCLGLSWVTASLGCPCLGAFIAGVVLADSDYSHQATTEILPFRDVFNSLFFVSIGMLLSLSTLAGNFGNVALLVVGLIVGKVILVWAVVRILGFPQRIAAMAALGLAQIGEFSFVLAKTARGTDLLPNVDYQAFLAASIVSMIATPFLIAAAPRFSYFIQSLFKDGKAQALENAESDDIHMTSSGGLQQHVIIVGYGLNGRNLARVLRAVGVPYVVLDVNASAVNRARRRRKDILATQHAARSCSTSISTERGTCARDLGSTGRSRTVRQARQLSETVHIIVRTRYVSEIAELYDLGRERGHSRGIRDQHRDLFARLHRYGIPVK